MADLLLEKYRLSERLRPFPDLLQFLEETKSMAKVIGFANTAKEPPFVFDKQGHPLLKVEGVLTPWKQIKKTLRYDSDHKQIRDIKGQVWFYLSSMDGFIPFNRSHSSELLPVYKLSPKEYNLLKSHAEDFFLLQKEKNPKQAKSCILQLITNTSTKVSNLRMMLDPPHAWTRIILDNGLVYSFGLQTNLDFIKKAPLTRFFATLPAKLPMLDFAEFLNEHKDHLVTSIPITNACAEEILAEVKEFNEKKLRFQYLRQNCTNLASFFVDKSGYFIDIRCSLAEFLWLHLPDAKSFGSFFERAFSFWKKTFVSLWKSFPKTLQKTIEKSLLVLLYFPKKVLTIALNLLLLLFGGMVTPQKLSEKILEEPLSKKKVLQFSTLLRSWKDIFDDEVNVIHHPAKITLWQKKQSSSYVHKANGSPYLSILPEKLP